MLQEYTDYLSIILRLAESTVNSYVYDYYQFESFLQYKNISMQNVNSANILEFIAYISRNKTLSPRTTKRALVALKHLYHYLILINVIDSSPMDNIDMPECSAKLHRNYTVNEINQILESPNTAKKTGIRDRAMFELMYATGIRRSELVSLQLIDVDLTSHFITVLGKGGNERLIPLTQVSQFWIEKYLAKRMQLLNPSKPSEYLFLSQNGSNISAKTLYASVKTHAKAVGLKDFSPHTFRHAFATHLLQNGANLMMIKSLLGHVSINNTQIYTHVEDMRLAEIHKQHHPRA